MIEQKKKLVSSVISQGIYVGVSTIFNILIVPIIIGKTDLYTYSVYEIMWSFTFIHIFLELGLGSVILKFTKDYQKQGVSAYSQYVFTLFAVKLLLSALGMLILLVARPLVVSAFSISSDIIESFALSWGIFAVGTLVQGLASFFANLSKGKLENRVVLVSNTASYLVTLIVMFFVQNLDLVGISIVLMLGRPLVQLVLYLLFSARDPNISIRYFRVSLGVLSNVKTYFLGFSMITLLAQIYNRLPKLLIGIVIGTEAVGVVGIIEKMRYVISQVNDAYLRPFIVAFKRKSSDDKEEKQDKKDFYSINALQIYIALVVFGIGLFFNDIIQLWIGRELPNGMANFIAWFAPFLLPQPGLLMMKYYSEGKTGIGIWVIALNTVIPLLFYGLITLANIPVYVVLLLVLFSIPLVVINQVNILLLARRYQLSYFRLVEPSIKFILTITAISILLFLLRSYSVRVISIAKAISFGVLLFVNHKFIQKIPLSGLLRGKF